MRDEIDKIGCKKLIEFFGDLNAIVIFHERVLRDVGGRFEGTQITTA
jgi:hypothetical protein